VINALEFHVSEKSRKLEIASDKRLLVIASGNALPTGRIIFDEYDALYADEGDYVGTLLNKKLFDIVVVISASGEKHAPSIVKKALAQGAETYLMTCDKNSTAASLLSDERIIVTGSLSEPLTYNTSTYLGMVLPVTGEHPQLILDHIHDVVEPLLSDTELPKLAEFKAHYVMIPPYLHLAQPMVVTKFDELFGGRINGRVYTDETTKHAKTVVGWESELFTSIGCDNDNYGESRLHLPLTKGADYAEFISVAYYFVGRLQAVYPDWFRQSIEEYKKFQEFLFSESS
jgi:hypothetical protein